MAHRAEDEVQRTTPVYARRESILKKGASPHDYKPRQRALTPLQHEAIVTYLGELGE